MFAIKIVPVIQVYLSVAFLYVLSISNPHVFGNGNHVCPVKGAVFVIRC